MQGQSNSKHWMRFMEVNEMRHFFVCTCLEKLRHYHQVLTLEEKTKRSSVKGNIVAKVKAKLR